jgi:hypothetical protein
VRPSNRTSVGDDAFGKVHTAIKSCSEGSTHPILNATMLLYVLGLPPQNVDLKFRLLSPPSCYDSHERVGLKQLVHRLWNLRISIMYILIVFVGSRNISSIFR